MVSTISEALAFYLTHSTVYKGMEPELSVYTTPQSLKSLRLNKILLPSPICFEVLKAVVGFLYNVSELRNNVKNWKHTWTVFPLRPKLKISSCFRFISLESVPSCSDCASNNFSFCSH